MRRLIALVLCACGSAAPAPTRPADPRIVETAEGTVIGSVDANGVRSWLGVPFAAPPVGALRWREAQAPAKHAPLTTTAYRLPCAQIPVPAGSDSISSGGKKVESVEDCLYLNIWVPPHDAGARLPVMVWIHGGQYLRGATSQYSGEQLARLGHVIVVTIAYRLGPLGFLAHPALTAESPLHTSGNQALFDHLQALKWLHANLRAFDGDPERITLFGESAGSASTCAMMASPLSRGMFHRAILQSTACPEDEDTSAIAGREQLGRRIAEALGCKRDDVRAELACMRGKTDDEVMNAVRLGKVLGEDGGGVNYRFVTDGVVLPMAPQKALETGAIMRIPVLLGTTDDEMGRYIVGYKAETIDDFRAVLKKEWPKHVEALFAAYPVREPAQIKTQMAALFSDWANTCPIRHDARVFTKLGSPTYLYRFKRAPDVFGDRSKGAFHGSELAFLFPSVFAKHKLVVTDEDRAVAQIMSGYWGRFAATGDPNRGGAPAWPRYDIASDPYIALDAVTTAGAKLHTAECDLWDRIDP